MRIISYWRYKTKTMKQATNITTIGMWNVRSLSRCGKLRNFPNNWPLCDVIGLSETIWTGTGEKLTANGHKFWVGFLIRHLTNYILNYNIISSRIIFIHIVSKPMNITIILEYDTTSTYSDEDIELFYELIEYTISNVPNKDY